MNPKVDDYLNKATKWREEMELLRSIILECGLTEELKWRMPCYSYEKGNLVIIQGFKEYLAVLFFKGVLLSDPNKVLLKTGENTVVGRQIRFENSKQVLELARTLKAYIYEAIELEKAGVKVERAEKDEPQLPIELEQKLDELPELKSAFYSLTPGRQRAYIFFISQPKQSKTRESRVEKCVPKILDGKGLDD